MTSELLPYPDYKNSGLPWCPQIPSHWELKPNRAFLKLRKVLVGERHPEYTLLSLTKRGIIVRDLSASKGKFSADMGTSQEVRRGDLVMCLFDVPETPRTVGLSDHDGMITGAYTVLEPADPLIAKWLEAFYIAMDDRKLLSPLYSGLRNTIPKPIFLGTKTPTPPPEEQQGIVRFILNFEYKVRRFIRNRRRLIEVLNEQKQAIINRAVTRGLDPNVPLKPSGIDWLGDVPRAWTLKRLKFAVRIRSGQVDPKEAQYQGQLLIAPEHIEKGTGVLLRRQTVFDQGAISGKYLVKAGEVIYSKIRPALRKAVLAPCDCLCSADMYPLQPIGGLHPKYLLHLLLSPSATRYLVDCSMRVAMPKVNREALGDLWLCYPDEQTQARVVAYIDAETASLNLAVQKAKLEIDLVHEYRTRLIADVVTGKVDVRGLAPAVPLPADEPIDEGFDDEEMLGDDEAELVEEAADADG